MLEVQGVSKRYGETVALAEASIAFRPGTIHTILGENGSGKSTLVKIVAGVFPPDHGIVRVGGTRIRRFSPRSLQAAGVATVFQDIRNPPNRSVLDNLFLGCAPLLGRRTRGRSER
jgi:ABC-type sugar transport system ATPase subunit